MSHQLVLTLCSLLYAFTDIFFFSFVFLFTCYFFTLNDLSSFLCMYILFSCIFILRILFYSYSLFIISIDFIVFLLLFFLFLYFPLLFIILFVLIIFTSLCFWKYFSPFFSLSFFRIYLFSLSVGISLYPNLTSSKPCFYLSTSSVILPFYDLPSSSFSTLPLYSFLLLHFF